MRYTIIVSPLAKADIESIGNYIVEELENPVAALNVVTAIHERIASLDIMPSRYPLHPRPALRKRGIRKLHAANYTIFYIIDNDVTAVRILRVIYSRRKQTLRAIFPR